jgi:exonuclease VII large subunit
LTEAQIQAAFVESVNSVLRRKDEVIAACREVISLLSDTSSLDAEREKAQLHSEELMKTMQGMIRENARTAQDQVEYDRKYGELADQYQQATTLIAKLDGQILDRRARTERLNAYMDALDGCIPITAFDEGLWNATVETVTVKADGSRNGVLVFRWKDGSKTMGCTRE